MMPAPASSAPRLWIWTLRFDEAVFGRGVLLRARWVAVPIQAGDEEDDAGEDIHREHDRDDRTEDTSSLVAGEEVDEDRGEVDENGEGQSTDEGAPDLGPFAHRVVGQHGEEEHEDQPRGTEA